MIDQSTEVILWEYQMGEKPLWQDGRDTIIVCFYCYYCSVIKMTNIYLLKITPLVLI